MATVATFTIDRHQWFIGFPPPYVVAIVELDEDSTVRLTTNIVGCRVDEVFIGQRVAVEFERWGDGWGDVWIGAFATALLFTVGLPGVPFEGQPVTRCVRQHPCAECQSRHHRLNGARISAQKDFG